MLAPITARRFGSHPTADPPAWYGARTIHRIALKRQPRPHAGRRQQFRAVELANHLSTAAHHRSDDGSEITDGT